MRPDIRPISVLTLEIITSSEWWVIFGRCYTDICRRQDLRIGIGFVYVTDSIGARYFYYDVDSIDVFCWPCTRDEKTGMVSPVPWPIMEGEEEISRWQNCDGILTAEYISKDQVGLWLQVPHECGSKVNTSPVVHARIGFRPAQRQGGKWVWEKDA